jgi:hypothetical protein
MFWMLPVKISLGVIKITQVCELGIENLRDTPHFHYQAWTITLLNVRKICRKWLLWLCLSQVVVPGEFLVSKACELRAGSIKMEPWALGREIQSFRIMLLLMASIISLPIGKNTHGIFV